MWLVTEDGSFAVAGRSTEGSDWLVVRSHDEQPLIAIVERLISCARNSEAAVLVRENPGGREGLMHRGRFWFGDRKHVNGADYEWRMSIPRGLFTAYFDLVAEGLG